MTRNPAARISKSRLKYLQAEGTHFRSALPRLECVTRLLSNLVWMHFLAFLADNFLVVAPEVRMSVRRSRSVYFWC